MKTTNGLLVINKPSGYTSRDIVNIISKKCGTKKVGHTGTLDPLAEGVLVLCLGRYTKLVDMLTSKNKEYIAEIKLGLKTDTLDITGQVLEEQNFHVTKEETAEALKYFIGSYLMEVPLYSAIKINGQKFYEYARAGKTITPPQKTVHIYDIELLEFQTDTIKFRVLVEKGTYIRSLIRDICTKLNTIGTMKSLIRTKQGPFSLSDSYTLDDINNDHYKLLSIKDSLNLPTYNLSHQEYLKIKNGNKIVLHQTEEYLLLLYDAEEIAIYKLTENAYHCYIMLKI